MYKDHFFEENVTEQIQSLVLLHNIQHRNIY